MRIVHRLLIFLVAALAVLPLFGAGAVPVAAQDVNTVSGYTNVALYLYPEYDDSRLLVMLQGSVKTGTQFPVTVQFMVPSSSSMFSAGSKDSSDNYTPWTPGGGDPPRAPSGITGWDIISYQLTANTIFRIEYYDPIIIGKPNKTIAYQFYTLVPIDTLSVFIQEPLKSSNFTVVPAGQVAAESDGFTYHEYTRTNLTVGTASPPLAFKISYTKTDTRTSTVIAQSKTNVLPVILGVVGGIIIVAAVIFIVILLTRNRRPANRTARRRESDKAPVKAQVMKAKPVKSPAVPSSRLYCQQCGEPLEKGVNFCPYCGTQQ